MWRAASLAVAHANASGGCRGLPVRLVSTWSDNPWGSGVTGLTRLAYDQQVWAIVGAPDGAAEHLTAQVVAKAQLPFVSAVSTDRTTNAANVPWVFSCAPGNEALATALTDGLAQRRSLRPLVVVSCTDHDSRVLTTDLLGTLDGRGLYPARHLNFTPGHAEPHDLAVVLDAVREPRPGTLVLIAGPEDSAGCLATLRAAGVTASVFGGPAMGHDRFRQQAGAAAEGVVFPLLWRAQRDGPLNREFERPPDYTAAFTYDAVTIVIEALRESGFDRTRLREALRDLAPWTGVTGPIRWNDRGRNSRLVGLGTIRAGRIGRVIALPPW